MYSPSLQRCTVGSIPLAAAIAREIGLPDLLDQAVGSYGNEVIQPADTLMVLLYNITLGRQPLHELHDWVEKMDPRCFMLPAAAVSQLNDDRFARALDKLYAADRASLMTDVVIRMIRSTSLDLQRVHNDSTTVKAYGKISGVTASGLELRKGKSKDHRPDLKQLLFCLTVSADGAVPVHYKSYSGNRTDDTTHIETWDTLNSIIGTPEFLYVGDCKLCTAKQLSYITEHGGRAVTIVPETWGEVKEFKAQLRQTPKRKRKLLVRPGSASKTDTVYSLYAGSYGSTKGSHVIYWYHSSEKACIDASTRQRRLRQADEQLTTLQSKLNKRKLTTREAVADQVNAIVKARRVAGLLEITIAEIPQVSTKQVGKGRPGPHTTHRQETSSFITLAWTVNKHAVRQERRLDGIFPLLSTDSRLSAKQVLCAYKYQPKLEKRFTQLKSVHEAAPLLFKKIQRVEAMMFLFFLALMLQALIERKVRRHMKERTIEALPVYPEYRHTSHPTTAKILGAFDEVSTYVVPMEDGTKKPFRDALSATQKMILSLLDITESQYWGD